jgi:hypothetical protein
MRVWEKSYAFMIVCLTRIHAMKHLSRLSLWIAALLVASGCDPIEVLWKPNASKASHISKASSSTDVDVFTQRTDARCGRVRSIFVGLLE